MFGRRSTPSQTRLMMKELSQSYTHLRNAAGHVAGGTAERLGPGYDRARDFASRRFGSSAGRGFMPSMEQWRMGVAKNRMGSMLNMGGPSGGYRSWLTMGGDTGTSRRWLGSNKKHQPSHRWSSMSRVMMAGAAVGAAGAIAMRRRRQAQQWEEYEPIPESEYGQRYGNYADEPTNKLAHGASALSDKAASLAHSVTGKAGKLADTLHERAHREPGYGSSGYPGGPGPASNAPRETTTFSGFAEGLEDDLGTPGRPMNQ